MKKRNVFAPLTGVKSKSKEINSVKHSKNERWLFGVLPADDDAPTVEEEKNSKRYFVLGGIALLFLLVLAGRAFYLQVITGKKSLVLAQENRFREQVLRAPRGLFYDRNKVPLVKNIPNYEVTVIPTDLPKDENARKATYARLAETISMPEEEIKKMAESKKLIYLQPILISKTISRETALVFESRQAELKGFYVSTNPIREYLDNGLLSHVFGYVGRISEEEFKEKKKEEYILTDFIGKTGLEKSYENIVRGIAGRERIEVDSTGKVIRVYGQKDPALGDNLLLSIDFELQKKINRKFDKTNGEGKS